MKSLCLSAVVPGRWDEGGKGRPIRITGSVVLAPSLLAVGFGTRSNHLRPKHTAETHIRPPLQGEFMRLPNPRAKALGYSVSPFHGDLRITPPLHYSITPSLRYSITPLLHHSAFSFVFFYG